MDNNNAERIGFTDAAANEDQFGITDYIGGLASFIETCNTPMTISIQGSWGTGKTSIMNLVNNSLTKDKEGKLREDAKVKTIWFNTWQFSQFDMDEQLATSLLSSLISEFDLSKEESTKENTIEETKSLITKIKFGGKIALNLGKDLVIAYAESKLGGTVAAELNDTAKNAMNKANCQSSEDKKESEKNLKILDELVDTTSAIKQLRNAFAKCVEHALEHSKKERIVVFIDDLDRLEPRKAVELLEVLKLFLDCEKCVFVLAIDYDVVVKGVEAKYGDLTNTNESSEDKGRSFFDKIIQVPFKMPIARYNITKYVEKCFTQIGMPFTDEAEIDSYVNLIKYSIGTNPRAMKRLFNSFQLLTIIVPKDIINKKNSKELLFASLCLQHCNENIYNFIVRNSNNLSILQYKAISEAKFDELREYTDDIGELDNIKEVDLNTAKPFMELFSKAMDLNNSGDIDVEEFEIFKEVISFSAITSASDTETKKKKPDSISISDLKFKYQTVENLNKLIEYIRNITGEYYKEAEALMYKSGWTVTQYSNADTRDRIEIHEKTVGFSITIFLQSEKYFILSQNIAGIINNKEIKISDYGKSKRITITARNNNEQDLNTLKEILNCILSN